MKITWNCIGIARFYRYSTGHGHYSTYTRTNCMQYGGIPQKIHAKDLRVNFYMSFYTQTVYMQIWVYFYGDWFCLRKYTQVACISLDVLFTTENVADLKISNRHCGKMSFRDERENKLLYTFSYYDHATITNVVFCNQRFPWLLPEVLFCM